MIEISDVKEELVKYSRLLSEKEYVIGPGGNTSIRIGEFLYIKPSGLTFLEMDVDDLVEVNVETGKITEDQKRTKPSSEILMHRNIYLDRPDITCIFHAHPSYTIGIAAKNIKFGHLYPDTVAYLGKEILVLDYIVPTTDKLADFVRKNLGNHNVIVLNNHGAITLGTNPKQACLRMEFLENLAKTISIAASIRNKEPIRYLTDQEMEEIINLKAEKYRTKLYEK